MVDIVELPLEPKVVLMTYLKGWIVYPILIFTPLILAIREIYEAIGLPTNYYNLAIGFAIGYLVVIMWILSARYDKKCLPQTEANIINEPKHMEE